MSKPKMTFIQADIAEAFVESLDELSTMMTAKYPPSVMRKKTWEVIRKRVPGVTQAAVTRTLLKCAELMKQIAAERARGPNKAPANG